MISANFLVISGLVQGRPRIGYQISFRQRRNALAHCEDTLLGANRQTRDWRRLNCFSRRGARTSLVLATQYQLLPSGLNIAGGPLSIKEDAEVQPTQRLGTMTDGSISRAQAMREDGQSVRSIAKVLGMSRSTLEPHTGKLLRRHNGAQ